DQPALGGVYKLAAVRDGEIEFIPKRWEKTYFHWLENVRDWCISRQLWWGHRIPVWFCEDCGAVNVSETVAVKCEKCSSTKLRQEEDVLDTWFSSSLWPFSTPGWPEKTDDLKTFYPTSVLITGFDIIYLWVARMIMMGKKFMGKIPFSKVYFTMLVRDEKGEKMSKSKGNAIDPLEIIQSYGTDALRFTLAAQSTTTADLNLSISSIEGYRNFANKIWNAARFSLMNLDGFDSNKISAIKKLSDLELELPDKYMLLKLEELIKTVRKNIDEYEFSHAAMAVYEFIWSELCDWYIEIIKPRFYSKEEGDRSKIAASAVLNYIFVETMKIAHPFMPFITEEIYSSFAKLPCEKESLMLSGYPDAESFAARTGFNMSDEEKKNVYASFKFLKEAIVATRQIRAELGVSPGVQIKPLFVCGTGAVKDALESNARWIKAVMRAEEISHRAEMSEKPKGMAVCSIMSEIKSPAGDMTRVDIYVPLAGLIDINKEKDRLSREIAKAEEELARVNNKLQNKNFVERAAPDVVEKEKAKLEKYAQIKEKLISTMNSLEE
ncbi:MAG TPA: class I tRNA ligase family protein, partial [Candidatus Wallbacteria bacterium]|nr:class I tRNA ligase family protein [Candidatus Wallbacteria bacterium]